MLHARMVLRYEKYTRQERRAFKKWLEDKRCTDAEVPEDIRARYARDAWLRTGRDTSPGEAHPETRLLLRGKPVGVGSRAACCFIQ